MTDVKISISFGTLPPPGFSVRRVKRWGEDDVMLKATWDVRARGNMGQFSMIEPYLERADGSWVGSWGAVTPNFSYLTRSDILSIAAMQIPDEYTLQMKMNYLYNGENNAVCEIWGDGDWQVAIQAKYGQMVHAGQMVAVADALVQKLVNMPGEAGKRWVPMRELRMFRRGDFGKTFATHPWLVQKATVSLPTTNYPFNRYGEYPRGTVYMTVMLDPLDFATGNRAAKAFLPEEWLA